MDELMLWMFLEMLSAFVSAWQSDGVPRGYLVGSLMMSLGFPVLAVMLPHPVVRALCCGGTAVAWIGFFALVAIGCRGHEKSPGRKTSRGPV